MVKSVSPHHEPEWRNVKPYKIAASITTAACILGGFAVPPASATNETLNDPPQFVILNVDSDGVPSLQPYSTGERSLGDPVPACIHSEKEKGAIQVYNDCDFDMNVKVIVAFDFDTQCLLVKAHSRRNFEWSPTKRMDGIQEC